MRFTQNTKGFTLIELLVVITIIGILAVGGTATYTAQIQKARDSTRLTDLEAVRSGIEQFYQDFSEYPSSSVATEFTDTGSRSVRSYVPKIPQDSKTGQTCNNGGTPIAGACDYVYAVASDANGIAKGKYRVSTAFENGGNITTKAQADGGIESTRFELGIDLPGTGTSTNCQRTTAMTTKPTVSIAPITATQCGGGTAPTNALLIAGAP